MFFVLNGLLKEDIVCDLWCFDLVICGCYVWIMVMVDGFMYKMVCSLVGVLVLVGDGNFMFV